MFLSNFGLSDDAIQLISGNVIYEKGRIIFPFSFGVEKDFSAEVISINRHVEKANTGLYIVEPYKYSMKRVAYFFQNMLDLLFFYDNNIKTAFNSAVLVVDPLPPNNNHIQLFKQKYINVKEFVIVSSNDFVGKCREIILSSYFNNTNARVNMFDETLYINIDNKEMIIHVDKFDYKKFIKFYSFPKTTKVIKPKGFKTFTELYNKYSLKHSS